MFDASMTVSLCVRLPELEEVQLLDVAFDRIELTEELTPKVRKLQMQNVPDECDIAVRLPKLEEASIHYFTGDREVIQTMLDTATKLRTFESYKL